MRLRWSERRRALGEMLPSGFGSIGNLGFLGPLDLAWGPRAKLATRMLDCQIGAAPFEVLS